MKDTFFLRIVSPSGEIYSGDVYQISAMGTAGSFSVRAGHIPFVTTTKPCQVRILPADGAEAVTLECGEGLFSASGGKADFAVVSVRNNGEKQK